MNKRKKDRQREHTGSSERDIGQMRKEHQEREREKTRQGGRTGGREMEEQREVRDTDLEE